MSLQCRAAPRPVPSPPRPRVLGSFHLPVRVDRITSASHSFARDVLPCRPSGALVHGGGYWVAYVGPPRRRPIPGRIPASTTPASTTVLASAVIVAKSVPIRPEEDYRGSRTTRRPASQAGCNHGYRSGGVETRLLCLSGPVRPSKSVARRRESSYMHIAYLIGSPIHQTSPSGSSIS